MHARSDKIRWCFQTVDSPFGSVRIFLPGICILLSSIVRGSRYRVLKSHRNRAANSGNFEKGNSIQELRCIVCSFFSIVAALKRLGICTVCSRPHGVCRSNPLRRLCDRRSNPQRHGDVLAGALAALSGRYCILTASKWRSVHRARCASGVDLLSVLTALQ